MKVLLSIKPNFVEEIVNGTKRYEYRKRIFKKNVDKIVIYASKPVGKIIGEFTIGEIIKEEPELLWSETKEYSGISKDFFNQYFEGRTEGFAIQIKAFHKYTIPIDPYKNNEKFSPPQSYKYIDDRCCF